MTKVKHYWNERWAKLERNFPGGKVDYYISDYGRIKTIEKDTGDERLSKGVVHQRSGYLRIKVKITSKKDVDFYIHKFVAEHFVENPEHKSYVIHIDRNKSNNFYQNLRWMTHRELIDWQVKHGIYDPQKRKRPPQTKMTETKVRLLKKRLKEGKTKKKILAKAFGITYMQLNRIERGENWGYVKIDE